jgi:hypothetical protein
LAAWITDPQAGGGRLAARVLVNRVWQHHFGRGLVATPNDFGFQGDPPSHPELLDWLAEDFAANGWKLKRLHRLILTSAVYRQSSAWDRERAARDLENVLLWRHKPRRLEAEAVRDGLLAVSGLLDGTMFGAGSLDPAMRRRSVYFTVKRSQLVPMMQAFDWPEHLVSIGRRPTTTVAPQALYFMNSPQVREWASALATRAWTSADGDRRKAVQLVHSLVLGREAADDEVRRAVEFVRAQDNLRSEAEPATGPPAAWIDYCQALLGTNEFLYIP